MQCNSWNYLDSLNTAEKSKLDTSWVKTFNSVNDWEEQGRECTIYRISVKTKSVTQTQERQTFLHAALVCHHFFRDHREGECFTEEEWSTIDAMQGFLTGVKQEVNRKHAAEKWALDDVVMTAEVLHPAKRWIKSETLHKRVSTSTDCIWMAVLGVTRMGN